MSYTLPARVPASLARADDTEIQILHIGDSIVYGSGDNGAFGGPRVECYRQLRAQRGDVYYVGTHRSIYVGTGGTPAWVEGRAILASPFHDGVPGATVQDVIAAWPGYVTAHAAAGWSPDAIMLCIGANNSGEAAAVALARMPTLLALMSASYPRALIFVGSIPPIPGSLAFSSAFNAGLPALCGAAAGRSTAIYHQVFDDLTLDEQVGGGVHPNEIGNHKGGARQAAIIEEHFPTRRGLSRPRAFALREPQTSLVFTDSGDSVTFGVSTLTGVVPGAGNVLFAVTYWPSALPSGLHTIGGYQIAGYNPGGYWVLHDGATLTVYADSGAPRLLQIEGGLSTAKPSRVVLGFFPTGSTHGTVGLWVNGILRESADVAAAWSFAAAKKGILGNPGAVFAAALGWYQRACYCAGSAIPAFTSKALADAIEADYYEGADLPGLASAFALAEASGALLDTAGGTDGGARAGSGSSLGNVKAMPWDLA